MNFKLLFTLLLLAHVSQSKREPKFSPYIDITRESEFKLVDLKNKVGITSVSLAFALSGITGNCEPSWAQQMPIDEKYIIDEIKAFRGVGGDVIVSTGGQQGMALENQCKSSADLVKAYERVIAVTGATHLDLDIEAVVPNVDMVSEALATIQKNHPGFTVSFTVTVMGDDYGINKELGVDIITNAVSHGVDVDIVNAMTMDYIKRMPSFGDSIISTGEMTVQQMKTIWPKKSEQELYTMLGITPMIGQNDMGSTFELDHAKKLVDWAKAKGVGHLAFWSIGRDKPCTNLGLFAVPYCSGISQGQYEFTKIFLKFEDPNYNPTLPTQSTTTSVPHSTHPSDWTPGPEDCAKDNVIYPDYKDCTKFYICDAGKPRLESCSPGTIWDIDLHICNFPTAVKNRPECSSEF